MNQDLRVQRTIFFALLLSLGIYAGITYYMCQRNANEPLAEALHRPMVIPLYVIGAATFVVALMLRSRFQERRLPSRQTNIMFWALLESITIYGVVLSFITFDWRLIIPPAALTVLGFVFSYPQDQTI